MKEVTLKELGARLPVGIIGEDGKSLHKDFSIKRWTAKQERELGKLRQESKTLSMPEHITLVLMTLCESIGPHNFAEMNKPAEKKLAISQMISGDVFYLYCYIRCRALGYSLGFDAECLLCGTKYQQEVDLSDMTSVVADTLEETFWKYSLEVPFEFRNVEAKTLNMGPTYWHTIEKAEVEGRLDLEGGKMSMIAGCVRGVEEFPEQVPLIVDELDEMDKIDIVKIIDKMNDHHYGPDMRLITECPNCKNEVVQPINWSYSDFFGSSSLSRTRGNSSSKSLQAPTSQKEGRQ